jgi:AbiV family abortive infection protein
VRVVSNSSRPDYLLSSKLLRGFRDAAIDNARELLHEASLLRSHHHHARAFFAARIAIEEIGKAVQAFDALGRNINDPAVSARVIDNFDDHEKKLWAAAFPLMQREPGQRDDVTALIESMISARMDTETALRTAIDPLSDPLGPCVNAPGTRVSAAQAGRWVDLARSIFSHAEAYVYSPTKIRTRAEDDAFALKPAALLASTEFWNFYIARMNAGDAAFDKAVEAFRRNRHAHSPRFDGGDLECRDS